MKNFRYIFNTLTICTLTLSIQAQSIPIHSFSSTTLCATATKVIPSKKSNKNNLSQKSLVVTKQRRLKSYQHNHKIVRKRKITNPKDIHAVKD